MPRCLTHAVVLALATVLTRVPARAEQRATTPYRGVVVTAFNQKETKRIFGVVGTAVVAFDGYAEDLEAVLVLTTRRGPCVDSGKLDTGGLLPMIKLTGKCRGITGLFFIGGTASDTAGFQAQ